MSARLKSAIVPQDLSANIASFFSGRSDILLVFVFGSTASGKTTRQSDVDLALLFSDVPDVFVINELRDELAGRLKKEVDIAVLNGASPILKMQVLKNGALVFKRSASSYSSFFTETLNQYDDLKQTRKISEEHILKGRIYAR